MNILSHLAVGEQFLGTKLLRPLESKIILKGKLASYSEFHKWKLSNHEELLAFVSIDESLISYKEEKKEKEIIYM